MEDSSTTYDVFLSYNSQDQPAVEEVARKLRESGFSVFLDHWYLIAGTPWPEQLEQVLSACRSVAVFLGAHGMGRWQRREQYLALDRQVQTSRFPVIPVLLPGADPALGILSLNTWVDMRQGLAADSLLLLGSAIKGEPPGPDLQVKIATSLASICPYRGLKFFREEDSAFFFGRDAFVDHLIAAVDQHQFVAVMGQSGSGKSSVVRAGLMPRLRRKDGKRVWEIATMVPGDRPLQNLAAVMVSFLEPDLPEVDRLKEIGKLADSFQSGEIKLRDAVSRVLEKQPGTDRFMLLVDQWEELYTLTRDESVRGRFIDELLDATTLGPLSVVLTLRGDFYRDVLSYRPLSDRVQPAIVNISPLTLPELRQAIEKPAEKLRLQFQSGLVDRILDEVEQQPGSLFLLEFLLEQLWKRRDDGLLTHAAYESLGKLQGAIATHAEAVYKTLTSTEQDIARRVFSRLVRPGTESADASLELTRRRISFADLGQDSLIVVRKLANEHLIVTGRNDATGEDIVDLVHEALISEWSRLKSWINDDLMFLTWRDRLRTVMSLSARTGRQDSSLLRGHLLTEALEWLRKREADLNYSEERFIKSSLEDRKGDIKQKVLVAIAVFVGVVTFVYYLSTVMSNGVGPAVNDNLKENPSPLPNVNAERTPNSTGVDPPRPVTLPALADVKVPNEGAVVIPVVVHVLYGTRQENISDEQIRSQIAVLNKDFRAKNEDISEVPAPFKDAVGDAHIEFILATTDPEGKPTSGITRTKTSKPSFRPGAFEIHVSSQGGADAWPTEKYLNIWVCNLEDGVLGYARLPGTPSKEDGVVTNYVAFGTLGTARMPNAGRQVTHDIGHFLGLLHLWGDKPNCAGTDEVDDTPPQNGPNYGKPSFPHVTCNNGPNGDMFVNFMDNADQGVMFTNGQVLRMHQTLQGPRKGLGTIKP
jgi:energy-coupling factor transporter ATP-binding protein EcfA2